MCSPIADRFLSFNFFSSRITSVSTSTLILEMAMVANNYIQAETVINFYV